MHASITEFDFKPGLPQEFEILNLTEIWDQAKEILTLTHRANFYHIIWFEEGNPTHMVDFKSVKVHSNSFLFLNKNMVHRFDAEVPFKGRQIIFTENFYCKNESDIKFLHSNALFNNVFETSPIKLNDDNVLLNIWQQLEKEFHTANDRFQSAMLQTLLHTFLLYAERQFHKDENCPAIIDAQMEHIISFKTLLNAHFKEEKKVSFYAQSMALTEKKLNIATSQVLGKTPKEVIDDRIMLEAKRLLAHTNISVKEICYALGYEEPTNFIKYFKKNLGITPAEFRNNLR
jgi:AraC family transcriptional activator of pobA